MGSLSGEEKHVRNGDSSFFTPPPECKRRKVSAVRKSPRFYSPNATSVVDEEVAVKMIIQANMPGQFSEVKERQKHIDEIKDEQHVQYMGQPGCSGTDKSDIKNLPNWLKNDDIMVFVEDKDKQIKFKSNGGFSNNTVLPERSITDTESERGVIAQCLMGADSYQIELKSADAFRKNIVLQERRIDDTKFERDVIVQCLMSADSYPSRHVKGPAKTSSSNRKKTGCDAQVIQKSYLTRSKNNAEILAEKPMVVPHPMDKVTCEVSRPLVLKDNEDYFEDEGPEKMIPSQVSTKLSNGKRNDYDAQVAQKHYLTRSKNSAEKLGDKSVIVPHPMKVTAEVSPPFTFDNNKDCSEDEGPAKMIPSQVCTKVSNGKNSYDAHVSQKRYLTRSKGNAEKLAEKLVTVSHLREKDIAEVSLPLALKDYEDFFEGPAKMSPSQVCTKVSNGNRNNYDAQVTRKCYLTRSKDNAEKLGERSVIVPPFVEEIDEVSRPMSIKDNEDDSEDEGPTIMSPSQVSTKVSNGKRNGYESYDSLVTQRSYLTRSKDNAEKLAEKSMLVLPHLTKETDVVSRPLRFEENEDDFEDEGPTKISPSQVSTKVSNRKRNGYESYDAQVTQKSYLTRSKHNAEKLAESMLVLPHLTKETDAVSGPLGLKDNEEDFENEEHDFEFLPRRRYSNVTLTPFVACSSRERDARTKVRETLRLFQVLVRKFLQEETNSKGKAHTHAANVLKEQGKYINTEKLIGAIPGVEIGDIFSCRLELAIIGLHFALQSGIDTVKRGNLLIATSVVASGVYDNDVSNSDVLIYTGQGGNLMGVDKPPEDQKLERGNLALKNCIDLKSPVRVTRGFKESEKPSDHSDGKSKTFATYTYDGLYTVKRYWHDLGPHGKLVYKFELIRIPGQHGVSSKEVKKSKKCKVREGRCVDDVSNGKERFPISAVNTIDDEKPPPFTYITSTMYPDWCQPLPAKGCDCKASCSDCKSCSCALKNGGEIPYNLGGAIVEAKPLVYECGPSCKCPPSCPNRVSQHGIKLPLEVFKTESMGWGVRCLSAIPSGSFICEYIGELLDDKEAEERVGSDEYLFDVGQNYNDTTLSDGLADLMPDMPLNASNDVEDVGFTIDAARYGNIGRFINHSCSPNLYAQDVLYDHEDKRIPHVMLFAAENIPPLQELTYHYNYTIDQVFDSKGNIKKKKCYCGSAECTGRMY